MMSDVKGKDIRYRKKKTTIYGEKTFEVKSNLYSELANAYSKPVNMYSKLVNIRSQGANRHYQVLNT